MLQVKLDPNAFGNSGSQPTICCLSDGPGYVLVYVDNQSIGKSVWFDNVFVDHYSSEVLEENHYYPYGLTLNTSAVNGVVENKHKYQGIELEKAFGLEMYETDNRGLDPQRGQFTQVDPLADMFTYQSPYASMDNNPANNTDPDGSFTRFGAWWRNAVWGGDGISKNKDGAWGVEYNYVNTSGQATSGFITQGSKPETLEEARERALQDWQDYDNAINRYHSVHLSEDGQYRRNLDNQPYDAPLSLETRGKMFLNMYGLAGVSTSPVNVVAQGGQAAKTGINAASKTLPELQALAKQNSAAFRQLFGTGKEGAQSVLNNIKNVKLPEGLSKEAMQAYRELINKVPDPTGTQAVRAKILDHLLK